MQHCETGRTHVEMQNSYPLPSRLAGFSGRIMDMDGHEQVPLSEWESEFGSVTNSFRDGILAHSAGWIGFVPPDDSTPISSETVFKVKAWEAPGAMSLGRRLEVLDYVGIERQMIFPGVMPLSACMLGAHADDLTVLPGVTGDRRAYANQLIGAYNDWIGRNSLKHSRYRFVAILLQDNVEQLVADTKAMIAKGVRAFWTPSAQLIGGHSPAHTALDPFWALLSDADATFATHISNETEFLRTMEWRNASAFDGWKSGEEFQLDPWTLTNLHLSTQNVIATMVMGGVLERHPRLRLSVSEVGANWLGPLAELMDMWHKNSRKFMQVGGETVLKMQPSEYLRRNLRISPFDIEDVAGYISRFGLEDCYCFASDLPHPEGGKKPIEDFVGNLAGMSDEVFRKFFVDNAKHVMPD